MDILRELASVAGVDAPAFVERGGRPRAPAPSVMVSPGLMPRPSLSEGRLGGTDRDGKGVAGVDAPAFVERLSFGPCMPPDKRCRRG